MWSFKVLLALLCAVCANAADPQIIYYYSQWSIWSRRVCANDFLTKFTGTSHIQYSFHFPNKTNDCLIETPDVSADFGGEWWYPPCELECTGPAADKSVTSVDRANMGCLRKVRTESDIKIGISLGGWTLSADFSDCVSNSTRRANMLNSIVDQTKEYGWDFIDFDWEYPNGGGLDANSDGSWGRTTDWADYKIMVTELRAKLKAANLSHIGISGAYGMNPDLLLGTGRYTQPTPMAWLCENLDFVSLMNYDLMGGWGPQTGWPAPLHHDPAAPYPNADKLTIEWQLRTWKEACGANFHKVILGLPAYAKSWRSVPPGPLGSGLYEQCAYTGTGPKDFWDMPCLGDGSFDTTSGTLEVWDIEALYLTNPNCKHYYHTISRQDWVYCRGTMYGENSGEDIWFAYDGPEVLYDKVKFAKELGVGGWMFWEASYMELGYDTLYDSMVWTKANALRAAVPTLETKYFWTPYENACHDAWNGRPLATPSRGERYPAGPPPSTSSTTTRSTTTRGATTPGGTTPRPTAGSPNCDEVTSSSVNDGSVSASCVSSFCTLACKKFMSGVCSSSSTPSTCVNNEINNSMMGVNCAFATV